MSQNNFFQKIFWGFMGLLLLNCSVDSPDTQADHLIDSLSINDQESLLEILIEKVFKFDNAIAEYDDDDTESTSHKRTASVDFFVLPPPGAYHPIIPEAGNTLSMMATPRYALPSREIHAPPPEA